jgi:hypothetical protein
MFFWLLDTGTVDMTPEYFFEQDGHQHGPFSPAQMKELAASGRLRPTDLVWKEGMNRTPAAQVQGLMPSPVAGNMPPPATFSPPPYTPPTGQPYAPATFGSRVTAAGQMASMQFQKSNKKLWIVLGVVGGVLFLCCGGPLLIMGLAGMGESAGRKAPRSHRRSTAL